MSDFTHTLGTPILELGGFRLLSVLGEGSFATAYLAQQIGTERRAVLKVAHAHLIRGPHGEMIRQRFDAEVRAITRIQHPNMVTVYTSGLTPENIPYIAMEFIQGHSLDHRLIHTAPLRREIVLTLFEQVASVLKSAHSLGVVHRDITPSNIMIQEDAHGMPIARVLDFGIAMLDEKHTHTVGPIGTPRYLAPEQLNGRAVAQSDIFSLGAIMWWALTGREYLDQAASIFDIFRIYNHEGVPNDPRTVRAEVDPELASLVTAMLQASPAARPDAAAVQRRLQILRERDSKNSFLVRPMTPIAGTSSLANQMARISTEELGLGLETSDVISAELTDELANVQILHLGNPSPFSSIINRQLEHSSAEVYNVTDIDAAREAMEQLVPDVLLLSSPEAQLHMHDLVSSTRTLPIPPLTVLITSRIPTGALPDELVVVTSHDASAHIPSLIHRYLSKPDRVLRKKLQNIEGLDMARIHSLYANHPTWLGKALDQVVEHVPNLLAKIEDAIDISDLTRAREYTEQLERAAHEIGLSSITQRTNDLLRELMPMRLHIARDRHAKLLNAYMSIFPTILRLRALLPRA
jgi:serine/threonine protein kinase